MVSLEKKDHQPSEQAQKLIEHALAIEALRLDVTSSIKLKSGRMSPYFFNTGGFVSGVSLWVLMEAYEAAAMAHPELRCAEAVYGPPYKGISLATGYALVSGGPIVAASCRKEAKDHGEGGKHLFGAIEGKRTLLIDDVMSSGFSADEGIDYIRSQGGIPIGAVVAFDRQERAQDSSFSALDEFQRRHHLPAVAAASLDDLIAVLRQQNQHTIVEHILRYRHDWGA